MSDVGSYLSGYVGGYWEGYDYAVNEGKVVTALGRVVAPTTGSEAALGPLPLRGSLPSAPPPPVSSLLTLRRAAREEGLDLIDSDLVLVHAGMVGGLRMAVETLLANDHLDAARLVDAMLSGTENNS